MPKMIYASTREQGADKLGRFAIVREDDKRLIIWQFDGAWDFAGSVKHMLQKGIISPVDVSLPATWDNYPLEKFIPSHLLPKEVNTDG